MNKKGLKILHQNVRGFFCNLLLLQKFMFTHNQIDIFCCTETHIKEHENIENLYDIDEYNFEREIKQIVLEEELEYI